MFFRTESKWMESDRGAIAFPRATVEKLVVNGVLRAGLEVCFWTRGSAVATQAHPTGGYQNPSIQECKRRPSHLCHFHPPQTLQISNPLFHRQLSKLLF